MQKNNAFSRDKTDRRRQFVNVLRNNFILMRYYFYILFLFFGTYVLIIRPKCKIKCRNGGRRGGLWGKIFFICLRAKRANKNKINFDEKSDDDAEMEAFYIFHEGVFFSRFNFYYSYLNRISSLSVKFVHVFFRLFEIPYEIWLFCVVFKFV